MDIHTHIDGYTWIYHMIYQPKIPKILIQTATYGD
jgi:hypothetical protein